MIPLLFAIVIFSDGRAMKIASATAHDQVIILALKNGGTLTVPLGRVAAIVPDELTGVAIAEHAPEVGPLKRKTGRCRAELVGFEKDDDDD